MPKKSIGWKNQQTNKQKESMHSSKWLLITHCYNHGAEHHSALIREVTCNRWQSPKKLTPDNMPRVSNLEALIPKWSIFIKPLPSRLRDLYQGWWWQKDFKREVGGWPQTAQDWCTSELTETVTAFSGPAVRRGSRHDVPLLTKKLFGIDTHWEREKISFLQWIVIRYINHTPGQASCPGMNSCPTCIHTYT